VDKLASFIPGGPATLAYAWGGADRMALTISTMAVDLPCTMDAEDNRLRVTVELPNMISLVDWPISTVVRSQGKRLMLGDKSVA
jgi:hypothetical protein